MLSRREQESVVLDAPGGVRITVTVTEIRAGTVRLGIEAPQAVKITRDELLGREAGKEGGR